MALPLQGRALEVCLGADPARELVVPVLADAQPHLDLHLPAGSSFEQTLPIEHNAFVYVYRGEVRIAEQIVPTQRMAVLANGGAADGVLIEASTDARVLLLAGQPLNEAIAQYGPFVMNTQQEIHQAISDFRAGTLGE